MRGTVYSTVRSTIGKIITLEVDGRFDGLMVGRVCTCEGKGKMVEKNDEWGVGFKPSIG